VIQTLEQIVQGESLPKWMPGLTGMGPSQPREEEPQVCTDYMDSFVLMKRGPLKVSFCPTCMGRR